MSVTNGSWQNTFGAMSARLIGLPTTLYSLGFFGCALPGAYSALPICLFHSSWTLK